MNHEPSLTIGENYGEFLIRRLLGQGGYGSVYEALWQRTGSKVALKLLHRRHLTDRDAVGRFLREAETLQKVDHPNVVDVHAFGEHAGSPYIVLEYLEGVPLDQVTAQRKPLSTEDALDIMLPVLGAVDAMHRAGIVHRDLKPGNIYLLQGPFGRTRPKVLDFGLAKQVMAKPPAGITQPLVGMGTPNYMAPEQIQDAANVSARSDQFSLGVILYVLLTGKRPFEAPSDAEVVHRVLGGDFIRPALQLPTMPPPVAEAITRAMRRDAAERFASLREFARALIPFARAEVRGEMNALFSEAEDPTGGDDRPVKSVKPAKRSIAPFDSVLDARALRRAETWRTARWALGAWGVLIAAATTSTSLAMLDGRRRATAVASVAPVAVTLPPRTLTPAAPAAAPPPPSEPPTPRVEASASVPEATAPAAPPEAPLAPVEPEAPPQEARLPAAPPREARSPTARGPRSPTPARPAADRPRPAASPSLPRPAPARVRRSPNGATPPPPPVDSHGNRNF